jgi:hypothetical protein
MAIETALGIDSGRRGKTEEVGRAEAKPGHLECVVELQELASYYRKDSETSLHSHRLRYRFAPRLPLSRLLYASLLTGDGRHAVDTSGSFVHIDCKGTACRTLFLSLHNWCKQLVFDRQTLVSFPGLADPPHCSRCGRVRYNGVARDH